MSQAPTSSSGVQGSKERSDVAEDAKRSSIPSREKLETGEKINIENQDGGDEIRLHETPVSDIQSVDQRQEDLKSSLEPATELKAASGIFVKPEPGAKTYFETSTKSHGEVSPRTQSYYEFSTAEETLSGETGNIMKKLDEQNKKVRISSSKMSLEQRSLSLNITVGSTEGHSGKEKKSRTFLEGLSPISGSFEESDYSFASSTESHEPKFPLGSSNPPASHDLPKNTDTKTETPQDSDKHQLSSIPEMLDLAGALPFPPQERREVDHMRRKSVPVDVSALMGSSLAKLTSIEESSRVKGGEGQLEEQGYCVFNEYSGPMPSPADVPSPGDSPHQCFPLIEREAEEQLRTTRTEGIQKRIQQPHLKGCVPETCQKSVTEKKGSPVKTSLILEKAVTSGVKPDCLKIPMTSSKDRLSGLPADIKIQVIPEVEIEKDPSREASPIPPDNSFTFTHIDNGSQTPLTPTTPKSPPLNSQSQDVGENAQKNTCDEVKAENKLTYPEIDYKKLRADEEMQAPEPKETDEESEKEKIDVCSALPQSLREDTDKVDSEIQSHHGTPARSGAGEEQDTLKALQDVRTETALDARIQFQEVTLEKGSAKPQISSPIIIIPQAQVDDEADDEDEIEIAEEPQEIMGEAEELEKLEQKTEVVRLMVGDQMLEEDPKSGAEEWSHSAINSDEGEPATDSSQLSPCSDHDLPTESTCEGMGEDKKLQNPQIHREERKKEQDEVVKKDQREEEGVVNVGSNEVEKEKIMQDEDKEEGMSSQKKDKDIKICQEMEETSNVVSETSQAANDETTIDVSILDTDSGWMDSQGTWSM